MPYTFRYAFIAPFVSGFLNILNKHSLDMGTQARQAWGNLDQKEEWSQELGRAPVPQTPSDFHVERMLATLVTRGGGGGHGWIYFFPQI